MKKTTVVVTGIGLVSPLGSDVDSFWNRLAQGESAIQEVKEASLLPLGLAGIASARDFIPPKGWEDFDRQIQFALKAARSAFKDAALDQGISSDRLAVYLSSSKGGVLSFEQESNKRIQNKTTKVSKNFLLNYLSHSPSSLVANDLGCKGPTSNFVSACASGASSIMMAARLIQHQPDTIVLVGSTEASLSPLILSGFRNMRVLAPKNSLSAEKSFCPFDRKRRGFVAAEGSAVLVLESVDSAKKRGVPIYCELAGSVAGSDSLHMTRFDPTGTSIYRTIQNVCQDARIDVNEIDYVNLHGTATKENDMIETSAVKKVWGNKPALSATKPITGHLLGASGAIEAVISVLALKNQFVPPTLNLNDPDPECDLDYTAGVGKKKRLDIVLSLSYGFGGHIGALVFKGAT